MDTDIRSIRFFHGYRLLAEVDDAVVIFISKWHTYGQFEIHLPRMEPYIGLDNRVMFDRDPYKSGVIKYINTDDRGEVTIKGYSLLWMLSQRITVPDMGKDYAAYNAPAEDIIVDLVRKNAVDPEDGKRIIPGITIATSQGRGAKMAYQTRYGNLADVLEELSRVSMLGVCIRMDIASRQDVFEVLEGRDKSVQQHEMPPVIFRRAYDNIITAEYTLNDANTKTCAYTAGQGEGAEREVYVVGGELEGMERKELYVDARDIEDATELPSRGRTKLAECARQENFEATVPDDWYGKRWDLGDIVTVIDDETGITLTHYISEIEEDLDDSGYSVVPTFGVPERSITDTGSSTTGGYSGGGSGGDAAYTYTKMAPEAVWEIRHNLGKYPSVTVVDSAGTVVTGTVEYIDRNSVQVTFSAEFSGHAYLN